MTSLDRTPVMPPTQQPQAPVTRWRWLAGVAALFAVAAVVLLAVTDHDEAATTVGVIAASVLGAGGFQVTVNIKR
ncbi:hypothetical protein QEZ40_000496 [Streptomyces katrae]|uniref:Uncharacterized protein n=1 Tax=Streptomyces katrae TaxID=68223 RepID=A0ABT7GS87_9ACTN|nr:hypothetical protein [Streptomyces katrae]MDK9496154.1 hypothetical protein [Streptomyces katrae]